MAGVRTQEDGRGHPRAAEGHLAERTRLDPFPLVADQGIRIRVKMAIDPEEGFITLDFTESDDAVPGGLNMARPRSWRPESPASSTTSNPPFRRTAGPSAESAS